MSLIKTGNILSNGVFMFVYVFIQLSLEDNRLDDIVAIVYNDSYSMLRTSSSKLNNN